jgi:hypothetical protein
LKVLLEVSSREKRVDVAAAGLRLLAVVGGRVARGSCAGTRRSRAPVLGAARFLIASMVQHPVQPIRQASFHALEALLNALEPGEPVPFKEREGHNDGIYRGINCGNNGIYEEREGHNDGIYRGIYRGINGIYKERERHNMAFIVALILAIMAFMRSACDTVMAFIVCTRLVQGRTFARNFFSKQPRTGCFPSKWLSSQE